jgi:hypothetical protein
MTSSARSRPRWLLHPATAAAALLCAGLAAAAVPVAAPLLLVGVAGAAAGFANSGST